MRKSGRGNSETTENFVIGSVNPLETAIHSTHVKSIKVHQKRALNSLL